MRFLAFLLALVPLACSRDVRIIGGGPARAGEFPFSAALYVTTSTSLIFCGGTVIDNLWLLTAATCVDGATEITIYLGANSLSEADSNRLVLATEEYIVYDFFNATTLDNNIALVRFRMSIEYSDYIGGILLPTTDVFDESLVTSLGWGQTTDNEESPIDYLNSVVMTTLSNDICRIYYGAQIKDTMVCAYGEYNEGTCTGDSGAPLVYYLNTRHPVLVGISSFHSSNGCESPEPSGYTRLFPYVNWIKYRTGIS